MFAIGWMAAFIVLLVIEIITLGLTTVWFAGGAIVAFLAALLGADLFIQILLFLVVSVVLLFFTRPFAVKYINKDRTKTNVDSMIGKTGVVLQAINNLQGQGQVIIGGMEWSAQALDDAVIIEAGSKVLIEKVRGVKLIVSKKEEEI